MEEGIEDYKCSLCGDVNSNLVDAIGKEEVVKVCELCARKNSMPIIHRATQDEIVQMAKFQKQKITPPEPPTSNKLKSHEDRELESIIKKNIQKGNYPELIDNFHWHIQQARRMKKMSQKQLANSIGEQEIIIDLAEQGRLAEVHDQLINKLEQFFRMQLRKEPFKLNGQITEIKSDEDEKNEDENEGESFFSSTKNYFKNLKDKWFPKEDDEESEEDNETLSESLEFKNNPQQPSTQQSQNNSEKSLFEEYYKRRA